MSFWNSFTWNNAASPIDTLLEKESFLLSELLDEAEILSELKAQNQKLLTYLSKEETLLELVQYVLTESTDETRGYKFAYLSSEIICSDNWKINDALFLYQNIWENLFQFVYLPQPLPPINSSYFNKVAAYLLSKKPNEIAIFLEAKGDFIEQLLRHPDNTSITEFLVKILLSVDNVEEDRITKWFLASNIIPSLVEFFDRKNGDDVHENISSFFINLINQSSQTSSNSLELYKVLEDEGTLTRLFNNLLSNEGGEKKSSLIHGLNVIIEIVKRNYSDVFDYSTPITSLPSVLRITLINLEKFISIISTFDESERFVATFGELNTPFGSERMKVLELLVCFISTRYVNLMDKSVEFNLLQSCFELFFKYPWNNILHISVQQITVILLESYSPPILTFMFETIKIHEILAKAGNSEVEGTAYLRKGYMGVVALLASVIENAGNSNELIQNSLENNNEWQSYVKGDLFEMRKKESKPLGGVDRPHSAHSSAAGASPDGGDEDDDKSNEIGGLHTAIKFAFENGLPDDFTVKDFEEEEDLLSFSFNDTDRLLAGLPSMAVDAADGSIKFVNFFDDQSDN